MNDLVEMILDYIAKTYEPADVWDEDTLLNWIRQAYTPEEIFNDKDLADWADDNEYVLRDDD